MSNRIVNIRGANGSGKSTVVRRILEFYGEGTVEAFTPPGRKRPLYYTCERVGYVPLKILGGYETPTGGCDTILDVSVVFDLAKTFADAGFDVLYEGILAQHSAPRLLELHKAYNVTVIVLTTPIEDCVESVRQRRRDRGDERELDPTNVQKEFKSVLSSTRRLQGEGVKILKLDREAAFAQVKAILEDPAYHQCEDCQDDPPGTCEKLSRPLPSPSPVTT